ncbi:MAG: peroxiredoxin [Pseudomonadota bacterium]
MTIAVGDTLPDAELKVVDPNDIAATSVAEVFGGRTVAMFAVPGAFTPTCNDHHLPGFLQHLDDFAAKGVDEVICLAVNDPFVLKAWADATGAAGKIRMVADGNGEFTKALGMDVDLSIAALGTRSKRYAMIVKDRQVTALNVEETPSSAERSSADELMKAL